MALEGTALTFSVHRRGSGTLLKVVHSGFPREEKWADLYGGAEGAGPTVS